MSSLFDRFREEPAPLVSLYMFRLANNEKTENITDGLLLESSYREMYVRWKVMLIMNTSCSKLQVANAE